MKLLGIAGAGILTLMTTTACQKAPETKPQEPSPVERGKYLVTAMACNDCHTPWKMGPNGPEPETSRYLSGHQAGEQVPPAPAPSGPWIIAATGSMTAWAGPWGVSHAANLTSDEETGIGVWDEQMFINAMRKGQHLGGGRAILPPMPWPAIGTLSDDDLKAILAYLKTVPPIKNQVPDPIEAAQPAEEKAPPAPRGM